MMRRLVVLAAGAVAASAGWAQQPVPAAQTLPLQQAFAAAEAIDAGSDAAAALAAWEKLEPRVAKNVRSRAIVQIRKSAVLVRLGRPDEAVAAARLGLAGLPATDPSLAVDRWNAWLTVGRSARGGLDYAGAAQAFGEAERAADTDGAKLVALLGQVETATYTDPAAATAALARAVPLLAADKAQAMRARFADARGLLLLNRGDIAGASQATLKAVQLRGGITERTDLADVSSRSNAAIALLLAGREGEARRYMAMTGAGRLNEGEFGPGAVMVPPECGGEVGLKPSDVAVVEFTVGSDGSVILAQPVYAAGGGTVALEFARVVRRWAWRPEQVAAMPPFFRARARVELRCTQAFTRPSVLDGLRAILAEWLGARQLVLAPADREDGPAALPAQRADLMAAQGVGVLPPLARLIENPAVGREERAALAARGLAEASAAGAPPPARLWFDLAARRAAGVQITTAEDRGIPAALIADPAYASDRQAAGALRLLAADSEDRKSPRLRTLLVQVAEDRALPDADPLKVGALIRLASLAEAGGDAAGARAAFARSGLSASQCALLDRPPQLRKFGGDFPQEAASWGFEGWTRVEFDVRADGRVAGERAIVSYPPFVFTKAGVGGIRNSSFAKTYRPDGGLGCGATNLNVRFQMP